MRISEAWFKLGVTGKNTTIAVIDYTIDIKNKELGKRLKEYFDVTDNTTNKGNDEIDSHSHGTNVMSVAAGEGNNSYCGVGVAYEASIISINPLSAEKIDEKMLEAFKIALRKSDIAAAAWGPKRHKHSGPKESLRRVLKEAETARDGRGLIIVHAAGNDGFNDDCAYDGYSTSPIMLSVNSVFESLSVPSHNEQCSAALIAAYTSGYSLKSLVWTTGFDSGECNNNFGGSSASAALITGVSSLLIDANPKLSWRDVQYIFAITARVFGEMQSGSFNFNAAGLAFYKFIGFGLADAYAAVRLAKYWKKIGVRRSYSVTSTPKRSTTFLINISTLNCSVRYVEHVTLSLNLTSNDRRNLEAVITSPSGTNSTILNRINVDMRKKYGDFIFNSTNNAKWPFMTVHFWGEKAIGNWSITVYGRNDISLLHSATLTIYGTDIEPPIYLRSCRLEDDDEMEDIKFRQMFGLWVSSMNNSRLRIRKIKIPKVCPRCVCPTAEFLEDRKLFSVQSTFSSGYAIHSFNKSSLHFYPLVKSDLRIVVRTDDLEHDKIKVDLINGNNKRALEMRKENQVDLQETTIVDKTQTESIQTELTTSTSTPSTSLRTKQQLDTTKKLFTPMGTSKGPKTIYQHSNEFQYYLIIIIFLSLVIAALVISLIIVTAKVKRLEKRRKRQVDGINLHLFKNSNML